MRACVLSLVLLVGCSSSKERTEATRLLEAVEAIRIDQPTDVRRPRVRALGELRITVPELASVRDACALAHQSLLDAEDGQARARVLIASAMQAPDDTTVEQRERIQAAIDDSTRGVERARRLFDACNPPIEQLSRRIRGAR